MTLQNITVAGLMAELGLSGHKGIATAINGDDATVLDVTLKPPSWVLLKDGALFTSELSDTTVQAPTTDGSYHLYVDARERVTATVLSWSIAAAAPSASALLVADVVVVEGEISTADDRTEGLRNTPLAGAGAAMSLDVVPMEDDLTLDHAGVFVAVTDAALTGHKKLTLPLAADCAGQWVHSMSPGGDSIDTADILLQGEDQLVGATCSMQLLSDGIASWYGMDC